MVGGKGGAEGGQGLRSEKRTREGGVGREGGGSRARARASGARSEASGTGSGLLPAA